MNQLNLNLLPSQARFQAAKIKLKRQVRLIMVVVVSLWLAAGLSVAVLTILTAISIKTAETKYKRVESDYLNQKDNIVINQKLKYKAKLVGGVLGQRFEYGEAFETINLLFPDGILLRNFELKDKGVFTMTGTTSGRDNVEMLEMLIEDINQGRNEKFMTAFLTSIGEKDENWTFTMEVKMK